jgi:uncharacterized membrane protein YedE/YeeE
MRSGGIQHHAASTQGFGGYLGSIVAKVLFSERGWPEWLGGLLLGVLNILFVLVALKPFTIYTGFLTWGQVLYGGLGLEAIVGEPKAHPLAERTSVGDIGLLLGAFLAAVASAEFRVRVAGLREYIEAAIGGLLMALGVTLAFGCNWGGFFSALTALSAHGYAMFLGLIVGGLLGSKYVEWKAAKLFERELVLEELERAEARPSRLSSSYGSSSRLPRAGLAILIAAAALATVLLVSGWRYVLMLVLGLAVGVVIQRSRFCFATAFRDAIAGPEQARAIRLQLGICVGIAVGATGVALLKMLGYIDPYIYVKPASILGVLGGILFGFGMVLAGGCASGSLWRVAEGNTVLLAALASAVASYPFLIKLREPLLEAGLYTRIFLPDVLGWLGSIALIYASLTLWMILLIYVSYRRGIQLWR